MTKTPKTGLGRREFLRNVGVGAAVAATASAAMTGASVADTETNEEKRKSRYQETDHVKTFYRVNRYPAS
jgi:hypothetical protein